MVAGVLPVAVRHDPASILSITPVGPSPTGTVSTTERWAMSTTLRVEPEELVT